MSSDRLCANCGLDGVEAKEVTRSFGSGATLLVVERVPMCSCPNCGESYFEARTLHELERIKALRGSVAPKRAVPVATFVLNA